MTALKKQKTKGKKQTYSFDMVANDLEAFLWTRLQLMYPTLHFTSLHYTKVQRKMRWLSFVIRVKQVEQKRFRVLLQLNASCLKALRAVPTSTYSTTLYRIYYTPCVTGRCVYV